MSSSLRREFFISMSLSKYSNDFKREVIVKKIDRLVAREKKRAYFNSIDKIVDSRDGVVETIMVNGCYYDFLDYCKEVPSMDCAIRLNESKKRKSSKVREKIEELVLSGNAIFITLTFNNDTLSNTSVETRRRYVARYLKANSTKYVANIDYGSKKGREHYHAVVDSDISFTSWYKYGAINVERVRTQETDLVRVSRYVAKLSNHALKVANAPRLIYSRSCC